MTKSFFFYFFFLLYDTQLSFAENRCADFFLDNEFVRQQTEELTRQRQGIYIWHPPQIIVRVEHQGLTPPSHVDQLRALGSSSLDPFFPALLEWHEAMRDSPLHDLRHTTLRAPNWQTVSDHLVEMSPLEAEEILTPLGNAMLRLYDSYRNQGPERAEILEQVYEQDLNEQYRATHFMVNRWMQPLAHVQLLESTRPDQKLHIEESYPDQIRDLGRRNPTEKIGELGRLFGTDPNQRVFEQDHQTDVVDQLTREDNIFYQVTVLKQALSYALFEQSPEPAFDRVVLQINRLVERGFRMKGVPLDLGERVEVQSTFLKEGEPKTVTEVIYSFDRPAMLRIMDSFNATIMRRWFRQALTHPYLASQPGAYFTVPERDISSLVRLGLLRQGQIPERNLTLWLRDGILVIEGEQGTEFHLYFERSEMQAFIEQESR